jgi:tetratricopeptide (TPR) repeat protein
MDKYEQWLDCRRKGDGYYDAHEYKKANEWYTKAMRVDPDAEADFCFKRGKNYFFKTEYERAIQFFTRGLKLKPENPPGTYTELREEAKRLLAGGDRPPPPPIRAGEFNFEDLVCAYDAAIANTGFRVTDGRNGHPENSRFQQINVAGWPSTIYYEFVQRIRDERVEVMFHISGPHNELTNFIARYDNEMVEGERVIYAIKNYGYGRLTIFLPCTKGYDAMARCMCGLIRLTKDEISREIAPR